MTTGQCPQSVVTGAALPPVPVIPSAGITNHHSSRVSTFLCLACLGDIPVTQRSWDFRYCRSCCSFLVVEARDRAGIGEPKNWVPRQSPAPVNLWFEEGDRVQLLPPNNVDGIVDNWLMVGSSSQGMVTVFVGNKIKQVSITRVVAHQKANYFSEKDGGEQEGGNMKVSKQNPTPMDNYTKVKQMLDKLVAADADARIVGLWKSKMAHAERMCKDVGIDPEAVSLPSEKSVDAVYNKDGVSSDGVVEPIVVNDRTVDTNTGAGMVTGGTQSLLNRIERISNELPPEVKAVVAMPKAQRLVRDLVAKEAKTPKAADVGVKEPTFCLCGCGGQTSHRREFLQGHDARLGSYIRKLDAGKMKLEELPESVQKLVKENHPVVIKIRSHITKK